ncbi:O-antigen ligase family protein [Patescibacteria group bacterium]|nr:O-antigen ligase family protein [Patescibacteria group bacterium]
MRYLERAFPWLLLAPAVLPVIVWNGMIYPYLVPKTLLFYALSLSAFAAFVILSVHGRPFYFARLARPESWIPAALLSLAYATSAVGIDFYRSFWSLFIRGDGLLMLTCAVASFYMILLAADRTFFTRLLRAVAVTASFVAAFGIGEWLLGGGRIGGLLGNAAFFAGYLGIGFFATLMTAPEGGWRRRAIVAGAILQIIAILLTATRGTMLALLAAGVSYLAYAAYAGREKWRARAAGSLIALCVLGALFAAFRGELARVPFGPVARIASASFSDPDIANRLFVWKHMTGEIMKSPWTGVGAEHIDALFNRFYDPTQISEQWFDRSHNAFLDYAAQYGIGGLLLYLGLIIAFFTTAGRLWRQGERRIALFAGLLAGTYAIQNMFVFDTISSFWLLLALLAALIGASLPTAEREALPLPDWMRPASWIAGILLIGCIYATSILPARAAYDLAHAYLYQLSDVPQETSFLSHGFALGTYGDLEYGYEAYDMYANTQVRALSGQARVTAYQAALSILTANFNRYTYDARTALYLAQILSIAPKEVMIDRDLLAGAIERAIRLSPKRAQPWYILVNLSISNANQYPAKSAERLAGYAAAEDIMRRYIATVPTLAMPHFVLAQLMLASGDKAGAAAEAMKGKADYARIDLETAMRAVEYYESVLDLPDAAFFLKEALVFDPTNAALTADLDKIQAYEQSTK